MFFVGAFTGHRQVPFSVDRRSVWADEIRMHSGQLQLRVTAVEILLLTLSFRAFVSQLSAAERRNRNSVNLHVAVQKTNSTAATRL